MVDATCPFVAVAQRKAAELREAGYTVVILGEHDHPEVVGLAGFAGPDAVVVEDAAELPRDLLRGRRVGVVVQTTQTRDNLANVAATLAPLARELLVHNTICDATEKRQSAACDLAAGVDAVVVVGGRNSANTARLAQLCRAIEARTHHVESAAELRAEWFSGARRIGVTAGASTPDAEIEATVQKLGGSVTAEGSAERWSRSPLPIEDVREAAARAGLRAGDCIARLNGVAPIDVLDLEMAAADGTFSARRVARRASARARGRAPARGVARDLAGTRRARHADRRLPQPLSLLLRRPGAAGPARGALRQGRRLPAVVPARQLHDALQSRARPTSQRIEELRLAAVCTSRCTPGTTRHGWR